MDAGDLSSTPPPPPSGGGDTIHPSQPPKDATLATILNVIVNGAGYFYIGQWQKGIAAVVLGMTLWFSMWLLITICIGIVILPFCVGFTIVVAIDVYKQALLLRAGTPIGQWTLFDKHK